MSILKFTDSHNMVTFLSKPAESFWSSTMAKTINREVYIHALVDGKKIVITETSVRRTLQLADAEGIECFSNSTIFENLALIGPKIIAWNEFSSTMASAIICLATNQKFNFSKLIFDSMVRNLDNLSAYGCILAGCYRLANKQSSRPFGSLPSNTQPKPRGNNSKAYQSPQSHNEHVNAIFIWSGKSYDPPDNPNEQNNSETTISFDSDDEDGETTP
ncbi:hypothetical protein Tco_1499677 [Tanacetum coccineum]